MISETGAKRRVNQVEDTSRRQIMFDENSNTAAASAQNGQIFREPGFSGVRILAMTGISEQCLKKCRGTLISDIFREYRGAFCC